MKRYKGVPGEARSIGQKTGCPLSGENIAEGILELHEKALMRLNRVVWEDGCSTGGQPPTRYIIFLLLHHRIKVNHKMYIHPFQCFLFNMVNNFVTDHRVFACAHFRMDGGITLSGTVIVDQKIVNA